MNNSKLAKDILRSNIYCTLATASHFGLPWAAPIFYALDDNYNFYFISRPQTLHSRHIKINPHIALAVFDSHQPEGTGNGVQIAGKAYELKKSEIKTSLKWYRSHFVPMQPEFFMTKTGYRFYKIVPEKFYILYPEAKEDKRIEVKI